MAPPPLTEDLAQRYAAIALGHVGREYPHSCVHGFWLLARSRRRFSGAPFGRQVALRFDAALTPGGVGVELAYLARRFEAAQPHVTDDDMGEHWLATYAVLALDGLCEEPAAGGG